MKKDRCECCGKVLISTKGLCLQCRQAPVLHHLDRAVSIFSYRLWNKNLMFLWKMQGMRALSRFFTDLVYEVLKTEDCVVVPVPPRKGKIKENGWDQIEELAQFLNGFYGVKVLRILERTSTIQQKKLDREERLSQIESAYKIADEKTVHKNLKLLNGTLPQKVWLLDDVCTTGSTIECCARLLKKMGIKEVNSITLFNVD